MIEKGHSIINSNNIYSNNSFYKKIISLFIACKSKQVEVDVQTKDYLTTNIHWNPFENGCSICNEHT